MPNNYTTQDFTNTSKIYIGDWFICQDRKGGLWAVKLMSHWWSGDKECVGIVHTDGVYEEYGVDEITPRIVSVVITAQEVA